MNLNFHLCDKCGKYSVNGFNTIRVHFYGYDKSDDKDLSLCPHCAQEFLNIVETFKVGIKELNKLSIKELAAHVYNTVGQAENSDSNESS